MQLPSSEPAPRLERGLLHWLTPLVLRHGKSRSTLVLTLLAATLAVAISQIVVSVAGTGDRLIAAVSALLVSVLIAPVLGTVLLRLVFELDKTRQQLAVQTTHDDVSGVYNRRHFMTLVEREWDRARRYNMAAALLLIDVDHFKRVNDTHGYLCGDELLREIGRVVEALLRQADVVARFGDGEFIVFLPHTDPLGALDVAERIREQVQALNLVSNGVQVNTTVSIGVAPMRAELPSLDWMIHEADTAMSAAKAIGCNCVRTLPFEPSRAGGAYRVDRPS